LGQSGFDQAKKIANGATALQFIIREPEAERLFDVFDEFNVV
jgi:hypothetical protein